MACSNVVLIISYLRVFVMGGSGGIGSFAIQVELINEMITSNEFCFCRLSRRGVATSRRRAVRVL